MEQCEHVTRVENQQTTMLASGGMQRQAAGARSPFKTAQFGRGGDKKNRPQGGAMCWLISTVNLKPAVIERLASGPASEGLS